MAFSALSLTSSPSSRSSLISWMYFFLTSLCCFLIPFSNSLSFFFSIYFFFFSSDYFCFICSWNKDKNYQSLLMIIQFTFFLQIIQVLFYFDLVRSFGQRVRHQQLTVQGTHFLTVHEQLLVGPLQLLLLDFFLISTFLLIDSSSLQLLFFELLESLLLFSFFQIFWVIGPLLSSDQRLLVEIFSTICGLIVWR